ncbi:interleukin-8 [Sander lucioperca]|uniref:Chemokine interleukin-8-like domain-containing protein n=1 Tax=Sander lucioperca TaxID=283035 RepID=A0A8C9XDH0_SANLU|nr:interleukin-8 [Sander lucioperca]
MTTKPLLLLAALTFCFCITSLHARCTCIQTLSTPVPFRAIKKIEVIPISGHCRRTEIIITRRNGSRVCINPNVQWVNDLLRSFRNTNVNSSSTTVSTTASTIHF